MQQRFGLRRTWIDTVPGIEMVQVHHAWTAHGQAPDWAAADTRVLMLHIDFALERHQVDGYVAFILGDEVEIL